MTFEKMRRRLMAVGLAACQLAVTAPAVYAAETDAFAEAVEISDAADETVIEENKEMDAAAIVDYNAGSADISTYSIPYALMEKGDQVIKVYGDEAEILAENDEVDVYDTANIEGSSNDGVFVKINGTYKTESINTILTRLDNIRLEAAQGGYPSPNGGENLSLASYGSNLSLKWSADLEDVASYRAVEQTCVKRIGRANGKSIASLLPDGFTGTDYAESVVFTADGLLKGLDLIKSEKTNYLKARRDGVTTGVGDYSHYAMLINPDYTTVGVGCFKTSTDSTCVVVLSMCKGEVTSGSDKSQKAAKMNEKVEISKDSVSKITASPSSKTIYKGNEYTIPVKVDIKQIKTGDTVLFKTKTGLARDGLDWTVMNSSVATVDHAGVAEGIGNGYTKILAYINGTSFSTDFDLTVNGVVTPVVTTAYSTAYIKAPDSPDQPAHPVTLSVTYTNAATYNKGRAIKRDKLFTDKTKIDISDLSDAFGVTESELSSVISYTWKYKNNKKVFVDENSTKKQPCFYVQIKLNASKAKKLLGSKNYNLLKSAKSSINKQLQSDVCYFYINPKTTDIK